MDSAEYDDILYRYSSLRLLARIFGTIEAALLFYIGFNEFREEIANKSAAPLVTMINGHYFLFVLLTLLFIGLLLAWWKEGLGGGIALACFIVLFIGVPDFSVSFVLFMLLAIVPSALYFMYWLLIYRSVRKAKENKL